MCIVIFVAQFAGAVQRADRKTIEADAIVAQSIRLVDREGNVAAFLSTAENGQAAVSFFDKNKIIRLNVGLSKDGNPIVTLSDGQGNGNLQLSLGGEMGSPGISLTRGSDRNTSIGLTVLDQGPSVTIGQAKGAMLSMRINDEGHARLRMRGTREEGLIDMDAGEPAPSISLARKANSNAVKLQMREGGLPSLSLSDDAGRIRFNMSIDAEGKTTSSKRP
jgi:hypothetical protein